MDCILWIKLQWNLHSITNISFEENAFENIVCKMTAILFRPQCIKLYLTPFQCVGAKKTTLVFYKWCKFFFAPSHWFVTRDHAIKISCCCVWANAAVCKWENQNCFWVVGQFVIFLCCYEDHAFLFQSCNCWKHNSKYGILLTLCWKIKPFYSEESGWPNSLDGFGFISSW